MNKLEQVSEALIEQAFQLAYRDEGTWNTVYFRKQNGVLFERINVQQHSRPRVSHGHIMSATVECAIAPGRTVTQGMAKTLFLSELGGSGENEPLWLCTPEGEEAWEQALIEVAP